MTLRTIVEGGRIPVGSPSGLSRAQAGRLQRFDEAHARRTGSWVFDWSLRGCVRVRHHVGVVQVEGLTVEILPKTDQPDQEDRVQRNLLYMLHVAGLLRIRSRSFATLRREPMPLLDAIALAFADSLLDELRRGPDRGYCTLEDNLRVVRGRLVFHEQLRRNNVHRERCYVRYDEFTADTPLNRLLKCACRVLIRRIRSALVTLRLREILVLFDEVMDVDPSVIDVKPELTRQNARYELHREFSRMVLRRESPDPSAGTERSFSLLFPMYQVFEAFVANLLRAHVRQLDAPGLRITAQARGRHLLRDEEGRGYARLIPDVLGSDARGTAFVLDTKWKLIEARPALSAVSRSDLYQLFAYSEQFRAPHAVLLYPATPGARQQRLRFAQSGRRLTIGFIDLARDLRRERQRLVAELASLITLSREPRLPPLHPSTI